MKVHLINYEAKFNKGILTKYAVKMYEELKNIKVEVTMSDKPSEYADINHHINYLPYKPNRTLNTLMITHIWSGYKMDKVKEAMTTADVGICMSTDTLKQLKAEGIKNLEFIPPAHDCLKRRPIVISILTNVYPDGCKREQMFYKLIKNINPSKFLFVIMGKGWNEDLFKGLQYQYWNQFDNSIYTNIVNMADYNLYFGMDEGSTGLIDSVNCGVRTISTPQGYHNDIPGGLDYTFETQEELEDIFKKLLVNPVGDWTWENYVLKHKQIWDKLIEKQKKES